MFPVTTPKSCSDIVLRKITSRSLSSPKNVSKRPGLVRNSAIFCSGNQKSDNRVEIVVIANRQVFIF